MPFLNVWLPLGTISGRNPLPSSLRMQHCLQCLSDGPRVNAGAQCLGCTLALVLGALRLWCTLSPPESHVCGVCSALETGWHCGSRRGSQAVFGVPHSPSGDACPWSWPAFLLQETAQDSLGSEACVTFMTLSSACHPGVRMSNYHFECVAASCPSGYTPVLGQQSAFLCCGIPHMDVTPPTVPFVQRLCRVPMVLSSQWSVVRVRTTLFTNKFLEITRFVVVFFFWWCWCLSLGSCLLGRFSTTWAMPTAWCSMTFSQLTTCFFGLMLIDLVLG
jgi:hypothetical protein